MITPLFARSIFTRTFTRRLSYLVARALAYAIVDVVMLITSMPVFKKQIASARPKLGRRTTFRRRHVR